MLLLWHWRSIWCLEKAQCFGWVTAFIVSSRSSVKTVLHHNETPYQVYVWFSPLNWRKLMTQWKLISLTNFGKFRWRIYRDLNATALLLGLKGGFIKYCCFLCLWDSWGIQCEHREKQVTGLLVTGADPRRPASSMSPCIAMRPHKVKAGSCWRRQPAQTSLPKWTDLLCPRP